MDMFSSHCISFVPSALSPSIRHYECNTLKNKTNFFDEAIDTTHIVFIIFMRIRYLVT